MMSRPRDMTLRLSVAVIVLLVIVALLAPFLAPADPDAIDLAQRLERPTAAHWMGTDELGRDVLSRMIHGSRVSLAVGALVALLAFVVGSALGALAGYFGGAVDWSIQRVIDALLCFPLFFLVLAIVAVFGPSMPTLILSLGLTSWAAEARLVRGEIVRVKHSEFALAARASGAGDTRLLTRHLLPHAIAPAMVSSSFTVANAILSESALSFLGFGIPLPRASWGNILAGGERFLTTAWWLAIFPGFAITLTAAAFYFLGDALRRRFDPRLSDATAAMRIARASV